MCNTLISIVIPVHNGDKTLPRCLESVFNSSYRNFECIVVDDFSTDNSLKVARSFDAKMVSLDRNRGAAYARNRGADIAQGDILFFIDADVEICADTLGKVIQTFEEHPDISAVFGSYDDFPGSRSFISQYKNLFHHYIHQTSREQASTFWSGCGAVKRDVFHAVGGFDQNKYSASCIEDIELGSRMRCRGYCILLNKSLQVKHLKHFSFPHLLKSDLFDRAIPWTVLMLTNKEFTRDLNLKPEHRLSALIIIVMIGSLFMIAKSMWFVLLVPGLLALFLAVNYDFYRFFLNKRGCFFTLRVIPFHLLYYVYSMVGVCVGTCKYLYAKYILKSRHAASEKGL